ncbi:hypothetical protein D3C73_601260 [compost metagenome]
MLEQKTMLLLPKAFFQRQLSVGLCLFVGIPVVLILLRPLAHDTWLVNLILIAIELLALSLLYPYSRYAVQRVIDYWHGSEQVVYDGSFQSSIDRKFAKLMVSVVFILVLGPACLLILLARHLSGQRGA